MCQPSPGVTLETRRVSDSMVEMHASGLEPGELPFVIYSTFSNTGGTMVELNYTRGADENGEFSFDLSELMPHKGQTSTTWDIRLIHSRGVACATITLP